MYACSDESFIQLTRGRFGAMLIERDSKISMHEILCDGRPAIKKRLSTLDCDQTAKQIRMTKLDAEHLERIRYAGG